MNNFFLRLLQLIPIIEWLPRYRVAWLAPDLIALCRFKTLAVFPAA